MENENENRSKLLPIRLKPSEFKTVEDGFKTARFLKFSEYIRSLLLGKPVVIGYRDKAMDEVLEELALLRRELNAIGNNLNQAVRSINAAHGQADNRLWLNLLSVVGNKIDPAIEQIKERIHQFSDIWSQKLKRDEV